MEEITKEEYEIIKNEKGIAQAVANLKEVTTKYNVALTTNMTQIKREFKVNLFTELLAVDKGLKARYTMARTDEAKRLLLDAEIISLDGYFELDEIEQAVMDYLTEFKSFNLNSDLYGKLDFTTPEGLLTDCNGCLVTAFKNRVIDIEDSKEYAAFSGILGHLEELFEMGALSHYDISNHSLWRKLDSIVKLPNDDVNDGKLWIDKKNLYQLMQAK